MQRPIKIQARQTPSTDQEGAQEVPPLALELPATEGCWGMESQFLSGMQLLFSNNLSCTQR